MARELLYTAQISALISQEMRDRIDALEAAHPITRGDVIRAALEEGLASVEREYALAPPSVKGAARPTESEANGL